MKKILCILFVVAIVASVLCVPAFAADDSMVTVDGVSLPPLPAIVDYSTYKYAFVTKGSNDYTLYVFDSLRNFYDLIIKSDGSIEAYNIGSANYCCFNLFPDGTSWGSMCSGQTLPSSRIMYTIVWKSFDLYDYSTGEKISDASTAVVDGGGIIPSGLNNLIDKQLNFGLDGLFFPALPLSVNFEEYPYVMVTRNGDYIRYLFFENVFTPILFMRRDDGSVEVTANVYATFLRSMYYAGNYGTVTEASYSPSNRCVIIASSFDVYDANTGELLVPKSELFTTDGRLYPTDFKIKQGFYDTIDAVDTTLNTGVSMLGSVAQTIATTPLLFVCFTVGFIGLGVALFKRIRK